MMSMAYQCTLSNAASREINGVYKAVGVAAGGAEFRRVAGKKTYTIKRFEMLDAGEWWFGEYRWVITKQQPNSPAVKMYETKDKGVVPPTNGWKSVEGRVPGPCISVKIIKFHPIRSVLKTRIYEKGYMMTMFSRRSDLLFNRFPEMPKICNKANLTDCVERFRQKYPKHTDWYPRSWVLKDEKHVERFRQSFVPGKTYILKPNGGLQGIGISLVMEWSQVKAALKKNEELRLRKIRERRDPLLRELRKAKAKEARQNNELPTERHLGYLVAQEYLDKPCLITA
uniref:Uncharacterized protein n=1 Tax=Lotharella globosa TaxID=91324 RepID=A0A7S3YWA7_9EUKA